MFSERYQVVTEGTVNTLNMGKKWVRVISIQISLCDLDKTRHFCEHLHKPIDGSDEQVTGPRLSNLTDAFQNGS